MVSRQLRHTSTRFTPPSSSAHPVTGIAPVTPVAPSAGVSNAPKGAALGTGALWARAKVRPAIVNVPLRAAVLPASEYVTVPLPLPLDPLMIVAKLLFDVAVQKQPVVVATVTVPLPPEDVYVADVGEML